MFRLARLLIYYLTIQLAPYWYQWKRKWSQRRPLSAPKASEDVTTEKPGPYTDTYH